MCLGGRAPQLQPQHRSRYDDYQNRRQCDRLLRLPGAHFGDRTHEGRSLVYRSEFCSVAFLEAEDDLRLGSDLY